MSGDNFFLIRRAYDKGRAVFVPVWAFASDDREAEIDVDHCDYYAFATVEEAMCWALKEDTEYGVVVHPECGGVWAP